VWRAGVAFCTRVTWPRPSTAARSGSSSPTAAGLPADIVVANADGLRSTAGSLQRPPRGAPLLARATPFPGRFRSVSRCSRTPRPRAPHNRAVPDRLRRRSSTVVSLVATPAHRGPDAVRQRAPDGLRRCARPGTRRSPVLVNASPGTALAPALSTGAHWPGRRNAERLLDLLAERCPLVQCTVLCGRRSCPPPGFSRAHQPPAARRDVEQRRWRRFCASG
jgi:hypothetical protein